MRIMKSTSGTLFLCTDDYKVITIDKITGFTNLGRLIEIASQNIHEINTMNIKNVAEVTELMQFKNIKDLSLTYPEYFI